MIVESLNAVFVCLSATPVEQLDLVTIELLLLPLRDGESDVAPTVTCYD
jgi:hypothetical protein